MKNQVLHQYYLLFKYDLPTVLFLHKPKYFVAILFHDPTYRKLSSKKVWKKNRSTTERVTDFII